MKVLDDEEVAGLAQRYAMLWKNPKNRDKMDELTSSLSKADQRRVRLCGSRMACGLPLKVIPSPESHKIETSTRKEGGNNEQASKKRRPDAIDKSAGATQKEKAVGAGGGTKKSSNARPRASRKKR